DHPLVVVNCTFFSFATNRNLSTVVKDGKLVGFNVPVKGVGKDSISTYYYFKSAIGIFKNRKADIAWLLTDSAGQNPVGFQFPVKRIEWGRIEPNFLFTYNDSIYNFSSKKLKSITDHRWKPVTAIGGGPVLLQNNRIMITNEEERMFTGNAINDKHPRTAMGYTKDQKLIILVIQGRLPGIAEGATLNQEAKLLQELGCWEALNLDGGGSSCLLINGKETIKPSDKEGQRAVPAVFIIKNK
ncbi:MAG TPA: phosphodiester glycosidase family protein, partial [Chitinophagaceae bacterium]|nr:phosphodiester glycosidase family protein [Chitinophagaceae bacterium]